MRREFGETDGQTWLQISIQFHGIMKLNQQALKMKIVLVCRNICLLLMIFKKNLGFYAEKSGNYKAVDLDCKKTMGCICQNVELQVKMRGLCFKSIFDRRYHLTEHEKDGRRVFLGPTGWKLGWIAAESHWLLSNPRYEGKILKSIIFISNYMNPVYFISFFQMFLPLLQHQVTQLGPIYGNYMVIMVVYQIQKKCISQ